MDEQTKHAIIQSVMDEQMDKLMDKAIPMFPSHIVHVVLLLFFLTKVPPTPISKMLKK